MRCATPHSLSTQSQSGPRAGLTVLELLLVLAILLAVGAFSIPALQTSFANRGMENAAEEVRQALEDSRIRAAETGFVYQFRYEPGANRFVVLPDLSAVAGAPDQSKYYRLSGQLESDTIKFQEELDSPGMGETLDRDWFKGLPDALELSRTGWSKAVEFNFEGQAENSTFYLIDDSNRSIKMTIRGLTGGTRVSKMQFGDDS